MIDRLDPEARSANMRAVRGKDTLPELRVRQVAHALGLRFRLHGRALPGSPDLVLPKHKTVIFVHGCFWHRHRGCRKTTFPKTRTEFWVAKFTRNVERDAEYDSALRAAGWTVLTIWECETRNADELADKLVKAFSLPEGDLPDFKRLKKRSTRRGTILKPRGSLHEAVEARVPQLADSDYAAIGSRRSSCKKSATNRR